MDFLALAKKRYACRKYLDRKVEPEKLAAVLEAGRVAPTGANRQPQRLIVVESPEGMERLARCTRDFGAPAAVVVCADTSEVWTRKYDGKRIGDIDASIVTDHMMLAAASLGLDTLWICMFKPEAVREEFGLPDTVEPVNILLIGYGADAPRLARPSCDAAQAARRDGLLRAVRTEALIRIRNGRKSRYGNMPYRDFSFSARAFLLHASFAPPPAAAVRSSSARLRLIVTR